MKLKGAVKHQYFEYLTYTAFCGIAIFLSIIIYFITGKGKATVSFDFNIIKYFSLIFLFVLAASMYKKHFNYFIQNGVSRQSIHNSFLLTLPIIIPIALINTVALSFNKASSDFEPPFDATSTFILTLCFCFAAFTFGRVIGAISYRLKFLYRIFVFLFVPIIIFLLLTVLKLISEDAFEVLFAFFVYFISGDYYIEGFLAPSVATITLSIIFLSISHLIIRKEEIKTL
ncbi:MAG: hypothetical protein RR229_00245 [Oscillospiraceae bacterium]